MTDLHGCTHGWEDADGNPTECIDCTIRRLTRERDEFRLLNEDKFRHLNAYRIAATEDKATIERLTRERDKAEASDARHLALLLQQRARTRRLVEIADEWRKQRDQRTRERDEAREAARDCYGSLIDEGFRGDDELEKWPWIGKMT